MIVDVRTILNLFPLYYCLVFGYTWRENNMQLGSLHLATGIFLIDKQMIWHFNVFRQDSDAFYPVNAVFEPEIKYCI